MREKIKIAYLLDRSNSWIYDYLKNSKLINSKKNKSKIFFKTNKLKGYDLVFILNYTKILKENFLKKNKLNLVVHASALPEGKGFSPLQWQILKYKNRIPMNLFKAMNEVDSGEIYEKSSIKLKGDELYDELREKQAKETINIITKFMNKFPKIKGVRQKGKSTYFRKRNPVDSKLDINLSIKKNFQNLRVANNNGWPAYFIYKKKKYILKIYRESL